MRALLTSLCLIASPASASIKEYSGKTLHIKAGADVPGYELEFKSNTRSIKFQPNLVALFSVGVSVQDFLGVNWGFRTSQSEKEVEERGVSHYEDYRLNLAFEQFHIFLNYGQYRGFFVEDSREVQPGWVDGQPFYQEENLAARTVTGTFTWIFSPDDFSLIAALDQTARQEDSGGSWLLGASVMETVFKNDGEIIPSAVQADYGADAKLKEGRFLAFNAKGGYGYTVAFTDKFFLSGAVQVGFGTQRMSLMGTGFDRTKWAPSSKFEAFLATGWNGDDNFFGLSAAGDGTVYNTGETTISSSLYSIKLFYGFRI